MALLYDRALTLTVNGQTLAQLAGDPDNCLRIRFKILQKNVQAPNRAQILVTNLSDATANSLLQEYLPVSLSAGYVSNSGLLFQGKTTQVIKGRENPTDTLLQVYASDFEDAYNHGVVNKTLAKGSTPLDHFNLLAQALEPFGVTKGYIPTDILNSPNYPRGVVFVGMVRDYMRTLSLSNGCTWSIQNGALQMVPAGGYVPGSPFVMNATSGMIGMPTQTVQGIMVRCLLNPSINLQSGNLIQLNEADIQKAVLSQDYTGQAQNSVLPSLSGDGIYRVLEIETTGDTRGHDWYMDLTCLNHDLSQTFVPQSQVFNLSAAERQSAQGNNQKLLGAN